MFCAIEGFFVKRPQENVHFCSLRSLQCHGVLVQGNMCNCNALPKSLLQGSFLVASQCCSCIKDHKNNLEWRSQGRCFFSLKRLVPLIYMTYTDLQLWPLFFLSCQVQGLVVYMRRGEEKAFFSLHMYDTLPLFYWSRFSWRSIESRKVHWLIWGHSWGLWLGLCGLVVWKRLLTALYIEEVIHTF